MAVPALISAVLGSCCGCMITVEWLVKHDTGCTNLMTFSTFLFIALEGIITETKFFTSRNKIPFKAYLKVVALFYVVNVINNKALEFEIPVPLHIIFRSGSLLASMILGMWLLSKRYSIQKYVSVVLITIGIITCTMATSNTRKEQAAVHNESAKLSVWFIGVCMLSIALLLSALLGIMQEKLFAAHGRHSKEAMFYTHALALPGFIFMAKDIYNHAVIFTQSEPLTIPVVNIGVPSLWVWLMLYDIAQYFCIWSVYALTAESTSLTVTLVVTLRKFISLLISVIYFQNPFTIGHWLGTALVFGGTLMFADIPNQIMQRLTNNKAKKQN